MLRSQLLTAQSSTSPGDAVRYIALISTASCTLLHVKYHMLLIARHTAHEYITPFQCFSKMHRRLCVLTSHPSNEMRFKIDIIIISNIHVIFITSTCTLPSCVSYIRRFSLHPLSNKLAAECLENEATTQAKDARAAPKRKNTEA